MEEGREQRDLFELEEPKKPFSKFANILPKPDIEGKVAITFTLEKLIFITIGIVMAMVLVFALGVETGKSSKKELPGTEIAKRQAVTGIPKAGAERVAVAPAIAIQPQALPQKGFFDTVPASPSKSKEDEATKPFTIVVATFAKKETAQTVVSLLEKDGVPAFVYYSTPYYQVCAGSYADKNGSQIRSDLAKIRRTYKDAYIKTR